MRFATFFSLLALVASTLALSLSRNAARLAHGMTPLRPKRLFNPSSTLRARAGAPSQTPSATGQCNTGPVQCCQRTGSGESFATLVSLLGLSSLVSPDTQLGANCSPVDVLGVGGNSCTSQPVCCQNNDFNGLIAIGCMPINLNLI